MSELSEDYFDFTVDLDSQAVLFQGGFSIPIYRMLDDDGDDTDELDEVDVVLFRLPPEGRIVGVRLEDGEDPEEMDGWH